MPCPKGPCEPELTFTDKLTGALVATAPLPRPGRHSLWLGGDVVFYSGFDNGDTQHSAPRMSHSSISLKTGPPSTHQKKDPFSGQAKPFLARLLPHAKLKLGLWREDCKRQNQRQKSFQIPPFITWLHSFPRKTHSQGWDLRLLLAKPGYDFFTKHWKQSLSFFFYKYNRGKINGFNWKINPKIYSAHHCVLINVWYVATCAVRLQNSNTE